MHHQKTGCIFFYMKIKELVRNIENVYPPGAAWSSDNPGIQVGSEEQIIKNVLISLDISKEVIREAIETDSNLIITHHPLLFHSIKKLKFGKDYRSDLIRDLIKNDITLFSAHTNFDFSLNGVNHKLADLLGLKDIRYLAPIEAGLFKIVVFVPAKDADTVVRVLFDSGAGVIGGYSECSFSSGGTGSFRGSEGTTPVIGEAGRYETVAEVKIEVVCDSWNLSKAINAMVAAHPYEEPAYDVYPLKNTNQNFGAGLIGKLGEGFKTDKFLKHVCDVLKISNIRYTSGENDNIETVSVCGGSGADLLHTAISAGADAFITADIKYHTFQDAENKILLIDAGHYETEFPAMETLQNLVKKIIAKEKIDIFITKMNTNPIKFYNNYWR